MRNFTRHVRCLVGALFFMLTTVQVWGQDAGLYGFSTNTTGSLQDMSSGTTQLLGSGLDDNASAVTGIGFTFPFAGGSFTQFSVNSNGALGLGATAIGTGGTGAGSATTPRILPFGGDHATHATGKVHFKVVGDAPNRILVVEWLNIEFSYSSSTADGTFQAWLYENGRVDFVYGPMSIAVTHFTGPQVGLSNGTGATQNVSVATASNTATIGTAPQSNTYVVGAIPNLNGTADGSRRVYTFTPPPPCETPAAQPSLLTLTATSTSTVTGSFSAASPAAPAYLVVRTTTATAPTLVNGTIYSVGSNAIGYIESNGTATSFTSTGLVGSTTYYYWVYSYSGLSCSGGPLYNAVAPNASSITTISCPAPGTYSVGPGGQYPTLTAAFNDLNGCTLAGAYVFELQANYTSASETFPLVLNANAGSSATNTVTVRPAADVTTPLVISTSAANTFVLAGIDYLTIDGRPGGVGTSKMLTIENSNTSGIPIIFNADASNNTVQYATVQGVGTTSSFPVIGFGNVSAVTGNDNNTIAYCDIKSGATFSAYGIYSLGSTTSATTYNSGNTVTNSNFIDIFSNTVASASIFLSSGNTDWTVTNNNIYQTGVRNPTVGNTHYGIWISTSGNGFNVSNNFVGGSAAGAAGSAWVINTPTTLVANRFVGIQLSNGTVVTTGVSKVEGNTVANFDLKSSSGATTAPGVFGGIYTLGSGGVTITNNTVGSGTAAGSVLVASSTNSGISGGIMNANSGAIAISKNTVGGFTLSGITAAGAASTTISHGFLGISNTSGTTVTVDSNLVGSLTVANSIHSNTASTATSYGVTRGINVTGGTTNIVTNNTVANIHHGAVPTSGTANMIVGINVTAGVGNITSNTVRNLTTTAGVTGTLGAASIIGLLQTSGTAGQVVSRNTVYALANTHASAAVQVVGLHYSSATTGTNVVSRNSVYNLAVSSTSATATIVGINKSAGLANFQNNMVRLGYGIDGTTAITTSPIIYGINDAASTANSGFYFNTVYIGGSGVTTGSGASVAFRTLTTTNVRTISNNNFVNERSNGAATAKHYAVSYAGTAVNPAGLTANFNNLYVSGTGGHVGLFNSVDQTTLTALRTAVGQDANSVSVASGFVAATAATPDLHLTVPSPLDAKGSAVAAVLDDFDGDIRANLSPTDIGADAGNYGPAGLDLGIIQTLRPLATTSCHSEAEPIQVILSNFSSSAIDFAVNPVTITTNVSGTVSTSVNLTINTGSMAAGATQTVTVGTVNTTVTGPYTLASYATVVGDVNNANDTNTVNLAIAPPATLVANIGVSGSGVTICGNGASATTLTANVSGGVLPYSYMWSNGRDTVALANLNPATTTNYRVTVTDACGTSVTKDTTITVIDCQYTVTRSTGITYNSIMADGSTYTSVSSSDDGKTNNIALTGTTFKYRGVPVTGFYATTNGWMTFNTTQSSSSLTNDLTSTTQNNVLAPFWDDLVIRGNATANLNASMRYKVIGTLGSGTADIVIEWAEMERFSFPAPNLNFQVVLHESDNSIDFNYGNMQLFDGSSTTSTFAYSTGLNGASPAVADFNNRTILQRVNTAFMATSNTGAAGVDATLLSASPECFSRYRFVPAASTTTTDPGVSAPANDNVAGAITVAVNTAPCTSNCGNIYSSARATASTGVAACSATTPGNADDDVWFSFTTTEALTYRIAVGSSLGGYDAVVQVLDANLVPVACANATGSGLSELFAALELEKQTPYFLRIYDAATGASGSGEFTLCISEVIEPPVNDDPAGAATLTVGATCTPTNSILPATLSATATTGITACSATTPGTPDDDVWYKFTTFAEAGMNYTVQAVGVSTYNPVLQIFSGTPGALTAVACVNATNNGGTETYASAALAANTTYYVRIYHSGVGAANGNFSVCVRADAPSCVTFNDPTPADGASVTTTTATISWNRAAGAGAYDVYFGTENPATTLVASAITDTFFVTPTLATGNVYYWKVLPRNSVGANTTCAQRSFNTNAPACLTNPVFPANSASLCVAGPLELSWNPSLGATGYDVYFGTGSAEPTTLVSSNQDSTRFFPTGIATGSYSWKVVPRNANGAAAGCTYWSFSVEAPLAGTAVNGVRCGVGTVNLGVTGTTAAIVRWYADATGGTALGTGTSFTTPSIAATTTFYAAGVNPSPGVPVTVGPATTTSSSSVVSPFYHGYGGQKSQYIFTAAELNAAGIAAGPISALSIDVTTVGTPLTGFGVGIATTTRAAGLNDNLQDGIVPVYTNASQTLTTGLNTFAFSTPFNWDGTSNLIVQFCYSNNNGGGTSSTVRVNTASFVASSAIYVDDATPANLCAATNVAGAAGSFGFSGTSSSRPRLTFTATSACEGARIPVVATVNPAPALTTTIAADTLCAGETAALSITSNLADFDTYTWSPSATVQGSAANGYIFTPSATTTYTLTASNATTLCAAEKTFVVTVNPVPNAPTVTDTSAFACAGSSVPLTIRAGNGTALSESFNTGSGAFTIQNFTSTGFEWQNQPNGFAYGSTTFSGSTGNFVFVNSDGAGSGTTVTSRLTSPAFSTLGYSNMTLNFREFLNNSNDTAIVEISSDNATWTALRNNNTTDVGSATAFANTVLTIPAAFNDKPAVRVRFRYSGGYDWYWAVDEVSVTGTYTAGYTWAPTTGLYQDAAATVPYTAGMRGDTVYAKPTSATTYTVTETNAFACTSRPTSVNVGYTAVALTTASLDSLSASCEVNGWTYYESEGKLAFAINWAPDGSLSTANAAAKAVAKVGINKDAAYTSGGTAPDRVYAMKRYWNVSQTPTFDEPVAIRFFFDPAEKAEVENQAIGGTFVWFKTNTGNYNPATSVRANGIPNATTYTGTIGTENGVSYVELTGLSSFSGGTGAALEGSYLGVELVKFDAKAAGAVNKIDWTTATETNTSHFVIERSANGRTDWADLGSVKAAGNSAEMLKYTFDDELPLPISYYRLRVVDNDGKEQRSKVVSVERRTGKFTVVSAWPNPTSDRVDMRYESPIETEVSMTVTNLLGQVILEQTVSANKGINAIEIDLLQKASGVYLVKLSNGKETIMQRVVKN